MSKKHRGRFKGDPVTYQLPSPAGGVQLETFVHWTLVKRGLKKQVITPLDAPQEFLSEATREREARSAAQDTALMRALGLAHHWQRLLDEQRAASVAEIAEAEGMDVTQVRRVMRLTLLAPDVVERLAGSPDAVLEKVMRRPWPNACRWCTTGNLCPLDIGETRAKKEGHHAIGRAAGILGRGQAGASGSGGGAGQRADAGTRTGAPLAAPARRRALRVHA